MYAVFESGGKQHRVVEGEVLKLEKLNVAAGESVSFDKVLLIKEGDQVNLGSPYIDNGTVLAEVVEQGRSDKIKIIKFKRRKHYDRQMGHRQSYTEVKITAISVGKAKPVKKAAAKVTDTEAVTAEKKVLAKKAPAKAAGKKAPAKETTAAKKAPAKKAPAKKAAAKKTAAKKAPAKKAVDKKADDDKSE